MIYLDGNSLEPLPVRVYAAFPQLDHASPRDASRRGTQVLFQVAHGYVAMQAPITRGFSGDFRAPYIMRFGETLLYFDANDVRQAIAIQSEIPRDPVWDKSEYSTRKPVT